MVVINADLLNQPQGSVKFILCESGIFFFAAMQQHRDAKCPGMSYEDDYRGNALAGLVLPDHVELRFNKDFPDARVQAMWRSVLSSPELAGARLGQLYYQGRLIL